jgi:hypothetical protein
MGNTTEQEVAMEPTLRDVSEETPEPSETIPNDPST